MHSFQRLPALPESEAVDAALVAAAELALEITPLLSTLDERERLIMISNRLYNLT